MCFSNLNFFEVWNLNPITSILLEFIQTLTDRVWWPGSEAPVALSWRLPASTGSAASWALRSAGSEDPSPQSSFAYWPTFSSTWLGPCREPAILKVSWGRGCLWVSPSTPSAWSSQQPYVVPRSPLPCPSCGWCRPGLPPRPFSFGALRTLSGRRLHSRARGWGRMGQLPLHPLLHG